MTDFTQLLEGGASAVTILLAGAGLGRRAATSGRKHREERETAEKTAAEAEARRDNTILELTWAIRGKDATPWEGARKGLLTMMAEHSDNDEKMFEKLMQRANGVEARVQTLEITR